MNDNESIYRQCGDGWSAIVNGLIDTANKVGATVDDVKEKYGTLRFYYTPGDTDDSALADAVEWAEAQSAKTCELCGAKGQLMKSGHWLKTLCGIHGIELGYKQTS